MGKLFFVILLMSALNTYGQEPYTKCDQHYFKNGRLSSAQCYDKDGRWGKAKAFDKQGKLIYDAELRRIGGNASVTFTYYPDGAVSKAHWHSAPDAGIQWYNTTTYFTPDGRISNVEHNDYNQSPTTVTTPHQPAPRSPFEQEIATCAAIYTTEYWYINNCDYAITVTSIKNGARAGNKETTLLPGDTVKGGCYINAEQFAAIPQVYAFNVRPATSKAPNNITTKWLPYTQPAKELRRYYLAEERY